MWSRTTFSGAGGGFVSYHEQQKELGKRVDRKVGAITECRGVFTGKPVLAAPGKVFRPQLTRPAVKRPNLHPRREKCSKI